MPLATYTTENALALFMAATIGDFAPILSYAVPGSGVGGYQNAVNRALRLYGLTGTQTITNATDADKLEAAARLAIWSEVADLTTSYVDVSAPDGLATPGSTLHDQALEQAKRARVAAFRFGITGYSMSRRAIVNVYDPYAPLLDSERTVP